MSITVAPKHDLVGVHVGEAHDGGECDVGVITGLYLEGEGRLVLDGHSHLLVVIQEGRPGPYPLGCKQIACGIVPGMKVF